jgi:ERCC4-related helicase
LTTDQAIPSSKIERCIDLTEQILTDPDEKVVIFTAFKETAKTIQEKLKHHNALLCTGDVPEHLIEYNKD